MAVKVYLAGKISDPAQWRQVLLTGKTQCLPVGP